MCKGVMKIGTMAKRVLTREMCERFHALESAKWINSDWTKVYFVDAAYGGDRCVGGEAKFGRSVDGEIILSFGVPKIIPVKVGTGKEPEEQIAEFVKEDCEALGIPPENMGHDATGRGSLGTFLARVWSAKTNPIEAGGKPSDRPVSLDITILDEETKQKRLKRCDEHFDRKVSEFHFVLRYAVESKQIRDLPEEAMDELCARKWDRVKEKYWVEPKTSDNPLKPGFKERFGKSPDMADWACGIVEMARRLGFQISRIGNVDKKEDESHKWLEEESDTYENAIKERMLTRV
jgi:hypothetical protein